MAKEVKEQALENLDSKKPKGDVKVPIQYRMPVLNTVLGVASVLMAITTSGIAKFKFDGATSWFKIPHLHVHSRPWLIGLAVVCVALTVLIWKLALDRKRVSIWLVSLNVVVFIPAFLIWTVAGRPGVMPITDLLTGGMAFSIPLIFGALTGALCERTGIINIAIEGQLLMGAFTGALVASMTKSVWMGLIFAPISAVLLSVLLALFTINFRADHIIVGVVLNMLATGVTSFFFKAIMSKDDTVYNMPPSVPIWKIPVLSDIPFIGPLLFKNSIFFFLMVLAVVALQFGLFRTRWGLRSRACGEHPKAADTVGIKVNLYRWRNVLIAGAIAGIGGAFLTLQTGVSFQENMSAGKGFIALAAMILGRWNPKGGLAAALMFGYMSKLADLMNLVDPSIPADFMKMVPYVFTILAVAGLVGRVRPPAMEGKPYPA